MTFHTRFNIGDIADFAHEGMFERLCIDEIRITTFDHLGKPGYRLIEYREHKNGKWHDGSPRKVAGKWWPEAYAVQSTPGEGAGEKEEGR